LVKGLGGYGSPKSGVSHWLWMSLLQQCYALTCYTVIRSRTAVMPREIAQDRATVVLATTAVNWQHASDCEKATRLWY